MHRLQEVMRLHRMGESVRRIARQLAMGRNTIREYLSVVSTAGLLEGPVDALPACDVLAGLVREHEVAGEVIVSTVDTWRDEIARLRSQGAGPTAIHDHLRVSQPDYSGSLSAITPLCLRLGRSEGAKAADDQAPRALWALRSAGERPCGFIEGPTRVPEAPQRNALHSYTS